MQGEKQEARKALHELMSADKPNTQKIMQQVELLGHIRTELQKKRVGMQLEIRIHGEVNATASEIELWSDGPAPANAMEIASVWGYSSQLVGRAVDIRHDGIQGAAVELMSGGRSDALAQTTSDVEGWFRFGPDDLAGASFLNVPLERP